jgi:PAS domain S-box-containing protein
VAMANGAMRRLLGYAAEELMSRRVWELYADPQLGEDCFAQLLHDGWASNRFSTLCGRGGGMIPTHSSAVVSKDDSGTPRFVIVGALPR